MTKFNKILKIILISLITLILGSYLVLYIIDKELAKQILDTVVDYANRPLPIVGVSSLVIAGLVWKIFQSTSYGKKTIAKMKTEYEEEKARLKEEYEQEKTKFTAIITMYEKEVDLMLESIIAISEATPNKKVKAVGEQLKNDVTKIKGDLRGKFDEIVTSNVQVLIQSKEEVINTIVDLVKKEIVDKYGEEGKETINSIAETKEV